MSIKDITIIITTFNSEEIIKNCLVSIDGNYPVIIVENSNNRELKSKLEREYKNVTCVLTGSNLGYGKANNIGLKKTKTKYALILNPDAIVKPQTLDNFFKAANNIPDFALIGPYIQEESDKKKIKPNKKNVLQVKDIKGFAMFFNLPMFRDIGFFDENFFIYFEEIDLCKRLINKNKKIYLDDSIEIDHLGGKSHNKNLNHAMELSRNWHLMWSTFYYNKKHKGFMIAFITSLPNLITSLVKTIFYFITFNKKKDIYFYRFSGLFNSIIGKSSWYRPKISDQEIL